jgi:hypothetical protein
MNANLKKIDLQGEILVSLKAAGRITQAQYDARLRRLVARAEAILAKQAK